MAAGCTLPPLRGEMEVGKDPYAVFVAEGSGGSDLYAVRPGGGVSIALTFSPVAESAPVLAPDGGSLAFLRTTGGELPTVWLMNLLSGAERALFFPEDAGASPGALGWSRDGRTLYAETDGELWAFAVPPTGEPAAPVRGRLAAADSALAILLGDPAFARAEPCDTVPGALCAVAGEGESERESVMARDAAQPARWGRDSVAYVREGVIEVRPLGPGRPRRVELTPARVVTGGLTYFPGTAR